MTEILPFAAVPLVAAVFVVYSCLRLLESTSRSRQRKHQQLVESTEPPLLAEYLLYFFLSKRDRVNLIGDLEEEYGIVQTKFGRRSATLWYYKQVVTSIGPQTSKWLIKWGAIGWVEEWVRRHL